MDRGLLRGSNPGSAAQGNSSSSSSIRRIQRELKEISENPSKHWTASPVADDLYEWQFAVRGPPGTDFEGGIYTGKITLPVNYPLSPPDIILLTPNGRWEVGKKICLSISSYHPELWQPAWGIRTMIEAMRSHYPMPGDGAVGALDWPSDVRRRLARESLAFVCQPGDRPNRELLPELTPEEVKEDIPEASPLLEAHRQAAAAQQETAAAAAAAAAPAVPAATSQPAQDAEPQPQADAAADAPAQEGGEAASSSLGREGLRQRRGGAAAADSPAASQEPGFAAGEAAAPVASTEADDAQAGEGRAASSEAAGQVAAGQTRLPRRRRNDTARPQRRARPLLVQLFKPPQTRQERLLAGVDFIIFLLAMNAVFLIVDLVRNPVSLLDPVPK